MLRIFVTLAHIPRIGEILSILAAFVWAISVVLFRVSGRRLSPLTLNFFKNIVATVLLIGTLLLLKQPLLRPAPISDYLMLLLAGFIGITIADTLFFKGLNLVGAGLSQVVSCVYPPSVILLSFVFLGERLTSGDIAGSALIIFGIFLSAQHEAPEGTSRADLRRGILICLASMFVMAVGVILTKPVLDRSPIIWSTTVRLLGGVFSIMLISLVSPRHRTLWRSLIPSQAWKVTLPAAVLGAYVAMLIWLAGMKYTQASTASILNQTSAVFVLPIAALVLGERITKQKLAAVGLAVAGVILVTLF
ncbi:DMT family transporter [bacterium]|nr:DMT family transporter [bacterium]